MEFLASTTFGTCLSGAPDVDYGYDYQMNVYHQYFLTWGFDKYLLRPTHSVRKKLTRIDAHNCSNDITLQMREMKNWNLSNRCFETSPVDRVNKKVSEYPVNCSLHSVLSCRLREGFTIKEVRYTTS